MTSPADPYLHLRELPPMVFTETPDSVRLNPYYLADRYNIQNAPRTLVLASIAIGALHGYSFEERGITVGIVASKVQADLDMIRRLTDSLINIQQGRERDGVVRPQDIAFAGAYTPEIAKAFLQNDIRDAYEALPKRR